MKKGLVNRWLIQAVSPFKHDSFENGIQFIEKNYKSYTKQELAEVIVELMKSYEDDRQDNIEGAMYSVATGLMKKWNIEV